MQKAKILTCLLLGIAIPVIAQTKLDLNLPVPNDPDVRIGKLSNGMTYYIRKNRKPENRMELRLAVNAGSMEENDDQQGLAHFCEHMAFNGTTNFKKSALVDYLESVGTKFGPHLNAYTSFDETVYMLQIPTDKEDILLKGFQILEDWAHGVTYENEEIDKERGVVTEEWRLGQGANERMRNKYFPILFKDSRYAERLPIGKPEILKNCKYETLKQFYTDWYRPELMAVVAVGDFDPDKIEKLIKEKFSFAPPKGNVRKLETYNVPDNKEVLIAKATDKEAAYTSIMVYYKHPPEKTATIADMRKSLIADLYASMLSARYDEIRQNPNTPFSFAGCNYGQIVRSKSSFSTYSFLSSDKLIEKGIRTIAEENERVRRYGFTASELAREKKDQLRQYETAYNERNKTESVNYTYEYVYNFLQKSPMPGVGFEYEFAGKYLEGITLEEVNGLSKELLTTGENCVIVITAPDKEGVELPADEKIKTIFTDVIKSNLKPYEDKVVNTPLLAKQPTPGKITEEKQIKEFNITRLKLSNGATVILKPTDFKNDEILFSASSFGGTSLYPDQDALSGSLSGYIIGQSGLGDFNNVALNKYLTGVVYRLYSYVSEIQEGMQGSTAPQDLETFMQLLHMYYTQPRKDTAAFASLIQQQMGFLQNQGASPESVYRDTIQVTMAQYHKRARPLTPEYLKEANLDKAYSIYKDRFGDAGDFMFCFVGNFEPGKIKPLIEKYIGSLPSAGRKETWKDVGRKRPKGTIEKTVNKGSEPKSNVTLHFTGDFAFNSKNRSDINALIKLASIKLREVLREEKGGVYGVQVYPRVEKYPHEAFDVVISFGCAPDKVEELTKAALDEIEKIKKNGCDEKDLVKIKETLRREREVNLKENNFWLTSITSKYGWGEDILEINGFNTYIDNLKGSDFKDLAAGYFSGTNYARFILLPEK